MRRRVVGRRYDASANEFVADEFQVGDLHRNQQNVPDAVHTRHGRQYAEAERSEQASRPWPVRGNAVQAQEIREGPPVSPDPAPPTNLSTPHNSALLPMRTVSWRTKRELRGRRAKRPAPTLAPTQAAPRRASTNLPHVSNLLRWAVDVSCVVSTWRKPNGLVRLITTATGKRRTPKSAHKVEK